VALMVLKILKIPSPHFGTFKKEKSLVLDQVLAKLLISVHKPAFENPYP
jgi:hypothetical protein